MSSNLILPWPQVTRESMFTKLRLSLPWFSRTYTRMDVLIEGISELSFDFSDNIRHNKKNKQKIKELCDKHLEAVSTLKLKDINLPDFKPGLEWVNVTEPLSIQKHLTGKVVVLDFFTYCCINCMHMLPELKRLEQEITVEDGLVVIGVHSAKFTNEKNTDNIEAAVRRYNITHPVVNDNVEDMWRALQVHCWPTIYVLGPNGVPIMIFQGEDHDGVLKEFVSQAIAFYKKRGEISTSHINQIKAYSFPKSVNILSYPGKVTVSPDGSLIAISDSAHNRVIIADPNGEILYEIGGSISGLTDGNFESARFFSPQGLCFVDSSKLFVADTENHCVREIDLEKKEVNTIVGIGNQGSDYIGGKEGPKQAISSPWDLCIVNDILFIAMAGTHQMWAYFFKDTTLWKKTYKAGTCSAVVGSGREENRNNHYPSTAALAQPSGLTFDRKNMMYFADSESSSIRSVNTETGSVGPVVGGSMDPRNLFVYGDKDGTGIDVKLQHPLCVKWSAFDESLYVADTYNHKIKKIEIPSKKCSTVGDPKTQKLNEPGGIYAFKDKVYIADTNNHSIKVLNLQDYSLTDLNLVLKKNSAVKDEKVFHNSSIAVNPKGSLDLSIDLSLPKTHSLTKEAPSKWIINLPGDRVLTYDEKFTLNPSWNLKMVRVDKNPKISVTGRLFLCINDKCTVKELLFVISVSSDEKSPEKANHTIKCSL